MPPHGPSRSRSIPTPEPTTRPIETPRKGMIVFEANTRSMCSITKVDDAGFDVWVHDGAYAGRSEGGKFLIQWSSVTRSGTDQREGRFSEVVALTADEVHHQYMDSVKGVQRLMTGPGTQNDRLEQLLQERGDDDELVERALAFLKEEGLAGRFADWLQEQPLPAYRALDREEDGYDIFEPA